MQHFYRLDLFCFLIDNRHSTRAGPFFCSMSAPDSSGGISLGQPIFRDLASSLETIDSDPFEMIWRKSDDMLHFDLRI